MALIFNQNPSFRYAAAFGWEPDTLSPAGRFPSGPACRPSVPMWSMSCGECRSIWPLPPELVAPLCGGNIAKPHTNFAALLVFDPFGGDNKCKFTGLSILSNFRQLLILMLTSPYETASIAPAMLLGVLFASELVLRGTARAKLAGLEESKILSSFAKPRSTLQWTAANTEVSRIKNIIDAAFKAFHQVFQRLECNVLFPHLHTLK